MSFCSKENRKPKIVAAIPCFNTEPYIGDIVSRVRKYVDEVVVVDDGSHDGTAEAARRAGAVIVSHAKNMGYGEAIKSCFEAARVNDADILVILDGDGQHNPDEIPKLLEPILRGEAELVIGSRFLSDSSIGEASEAINPARQTLALNSELKSRDSRLPVMPRYRRFGIRVITFLWNFGSKVKVSDAQSGFRAYSREIFKDLALSERGMSISIETLEKARKKRATIREVPISCFYTPSTLNPGAIKHGLSVALSVIKIRLKNAFCSFVGRH